MTDKLRQAADRALEALKTFEKISSHEHLHIYETITVPEAVKALEKALAEPDGYDKAIEDALNYGQGFVKVQHVPLDEFIEHDAKPAAWGMVNPNGQILDVICPEEHDRAEGGYTVPLYTAPPKREWQWLTEEDIHDLFMANETVDDYGEFESIACTVSAKLKEKNNG